MVRAKIIDVKFSAGRIGMASGMREQKQKTKADVEYNIIFEMVGA